MLVIKLTKPPDGGGQEEHMKFIIQRVTEASVSVDEQLVGSIRQGYLVLIGVCDADTQAEADRLVRKMLNLRIFSDENGKTVILDSEELS